MSMIVCMGAMLQCNFGVAPSVLSVLPTGRVNNTGPVATIMDNKPMVNIAPFGMCQSMSNPTVAAATAAAAGVLTPMPCIPVTAAPWMPGSSTVMMGSFPVLTNNSKCMCNWGGQISINSPASNSVQAG